MVYNDAAGTHKAITKRGSLTAWRNGDVKIASAECIPTDQLLQWDLQVPTPITEEYGTFKSSYINDRKSIGRRIGQWKSIHAFQTAQFCWWLMQTCSTTENTPVGYNTHAITLAAAPTPDNHGIHFERESISSEERRYDLLGFLPSDLVISCSETSWPAKQELTVPFAFAKTSSTDDIAPQTKRPRATTGTIWKDWGHVVAGNGGGESPSGFTYNSNPMEVDIVGLRIMLHRNVEFGTFDSDAYYTQGFLRTFKYSVQLDVKPRGDSLYVLNETEAEDYATDLDYDMKFEADATNDNIRFLFDKMYMIPFDELNDWNKWFEGYTITLDPLDSTSSLTITGIDLLDDDHYEDP